MPQPLLSFAFGSTGIILLGGNVPLLTFGGGDTWKLTPLITPGSGSWPATDFWIRGISLTYLCAPPRNWAIVGHGGSNGDWITPPVLGGESRLVQYPEDACPLFTLETDYLDVHVDNLPNICAMVAIWYVPKV